ncbi:MAG: succinate dehydrogenase/fumarate reductase iron-sulfur subunit [Elusimicrobia bacterium]|nr:succinate dehydrogenase/fumarate reductase iron-sulfur subunit [Elusimicrobiota bacterium]
MTGTIDITLKVWRQKDAASAGGFETYEAKGVSTEMSFLEMLDVVNEDLQKKGRDPIAFDHDCREGICGMCSLVIDGRAHGPDGGQTTCQLHMRRYKNNDVITVEPFRAKAFPLVRDLVVDRCSFDSIMQAGGYVSVSTGQAPDASVLLIPKHKADSAMDAAACIGCGACVAACPNASAMLFVAAKVSQLAQLPQGGPERERRVLNMMAAHDEAGFGACSNEYECEAVCPKDISVSHIARLNREYLRALALGPGEHQAASGAG